jgi:phage tail sheath gpL-like
MSTTIGAVTQPPANFIPPLFYVTFNNQLAGVVGQSSQPALAIGQTITAQPEVPVYIPSAAYAMSLFGPTSMLARMCAVYFKSDPIGPLYTLPLMDAAGASAATGSFVIAGTAAASGSLFLTIGGQNVTVGVNAGDTASVIATAAAVACTAAATLPVTAVAASGSLNLISTNKGLALNNINLAINPLGAISGQVLPPGITVTIDAMTGGATDPDLGGVGAAIGDQQYDFIFHPYADAEQLSEITAVLSDASGRWAWNRQSYGHAFTAFQGTVTAQNTLGGTINDQHTTIIGNPGMPNPPWDVAADWAGTVAVSLRNIASQPLQTLALSTCVAAPVVDWNTLSEEQELLSTGISVPRFDQYGNVTVGQCVTTYKINQYGQPDASYRYVTTMFTLMAITRQIKAALVTKFGRAILVPNGTRGNPNVPFVTPNTIRGEIAAQYAIMEANGLVVNAAAMIAATQVVINTTNPNRVDIVWRPALANGLDIIAMVNQFVLNPAVAA